MMNVRRLMPLCIASLFCMTSQWILAQEDATQVVYPFEAIQENVVNLFNPVQLAQGLSNDPLLDLAAEEQSEASQRMKAIKIFCKVLDHRLSEALGESYASQSLLSEGCRGYWLPESDVLITLKVNFPVHRAKTSTKADPATGEQDLWNRYETEITKGVTKPRFPKVDMLFSFNSSSQERIDLLQETINEVIVQYSSRLKQDFPFGKLTIIVDGKNELSMEPIKISWREPFLSEEKKELENKVQNLEEMLSLKKDQIILAERNLQSIRGNFEAGRAPESEVNSAHEKLIERQLEMRKLQQDLQSAQRRFEESQKVKEEKEVKEEKGTHLKSLQDAAKILEEQGFEGVVKVLQDPFTIEKSMKVVENIGTALGKAKALTLTTIHGDTTMIFQIQGEHVDESNSVATKQKIQITSY